MSRNMIRKPRMDSADYTEYLRLRRCGNKTRYSARWLADNAILLKSWVDSTDVGYESYLCEFCDHWHMGHPYFRLRPEGLSQGTIRALEQLQIIRRERNA